MWSPGAPSLLLKFCRLCRFGRRMGPNSAQPVGEAVELVAVVGEGWFLLPMFFFEQDKQGCRFFGVDIHLNKELDKKSYPKKDNTNFQIKFFL